MGSKTTVSEAKGAEQHVNENRDQLVEYVAEDRKLTPQEKETILRFAKCDDRVFVYTEEGGIMRRLLQHPEFQLKSLRVTTEDSWGKQVVPDDFDEGSITGVDGWIPIGVLSLNTSSRTTSQHADVVSERVLRRE
jgi:hypothetical protein